jgi:hypothetical protein
MNSIENNGEHLEFKGMVPEKAKWLMSPRLRLRCPACSAFITADPSFAEKCPCGRLTRRGTSGTIQAEGYPVTAISRWQVVPKEDLAEVDTLIAVLAPLMTRVSALGDQPMINMVARIRRLLAGGERAGAREIVERLYPAIDRLLESGAVDDPDVRQAFLDLGLRVVGLAQDILAAE